MRPRYFSRPRAAPDGDYDDPLLPHVTVSDHKATDTGLLDARGNPIYRGPNPMGFHWK